MRNKKLIALITVFITFIVIPALLICILAISISDMSGGPPRRISLPHSSSYSTPKPTKKDGTQTITLSKQEIDYLMKNSSPFQGNINRGFINGLEYFVWDKKNTKGK